MEVTMINPAQPMSDTDEREADVTALIEACGGDPRTAIRALLIEQEILEQRIGRLALPCRSVTSAAGQSC
jgi:hypothetical protein